MRFLRSIWRPLWRRMTQHEVWALDVALSARLLGIFSILSLIVWVAVPTVLVGGAGLWIDAATEQDLSRYVFGATFLASAPAWFWFIPWLIVLRGVLIGNLQPAEDKAQELEERLEPTGEAAGQTPR